MIEKIPRLNIPGLASFNAAWDKMCTAVETARNIEGSGSLAVFQGPTGFQIIDQVKEPIWIKLTSAGSTAGSYHFTQVYPSAAGAWTPYPSAMTGLAWEFNLTTGILGSVSVYYTQAYWINTSSGGEWRFRAASC